MKHLLIFLNILFISCTTKTEYFDENNNTTTYLFENTRYISGCKLYYPYLEGYNSEGYYNLQFDFYIRCSTGSLNNNYNLITINNFDADLFTKDRIRNKSYAYYIKYGHTTYYSSKYLSKEQVLLELSTISNYSNDSENYGDINFGYVIQYYDNKPYDTLDLEVYLESKTFCISKTFNYTNESHYYYETNNIITNNIKFNTKLVKKTTIKNYDIFSF